MKNLYKEIHPTVLILLLFGILGCSSDPVCIEEEEEKIIACIPDYDYVERQFFYLETPGDNINEPEYGFGKYYPVIGGEGLDSLELFISLDVANDWNQNYRLKYYFEARNDPNNDGDLSDGDMIQGWFYLLYEWSDYELLYDYSSPTGSIRKYTGIRLSSPLGDNKALIVRYKRHSTHEAVVSIGNYGDYSNSCAYPWEPNDPPCEDPYAHQAELICPPKEDFVPPGTIGGKYISTWNMMYRNIYSIEPFSVLDEFNAVEIQYIETGADSDYYSRERYLRIFGLDRFLGNGEWGNDGEIDFVPYIINFHHGYISFPTLQPFNLVNDDLYRWFSAGPPYYEVTDSVKACVDSLYVHLEKNASIYEVLDKQSASNIYEIVLKNSLITCTTKNENEEE